VPLVQGLKQKLPQLLETQMFPLQSASEVHDPVDPEESTHTGDPLLARGTQLQAELFGHAGAVPPQMSPLVVHTDAAVVVVVPLTQAVPVPSDDANGHRDEHAWPAAQHLRLAPVPQGVVPDGHPHRPLLALTHATPLWQQFVPHGVVPFAQQHDVEAFTQMPPWGQHPAPQT
jgi:hypothetical protein